MRRRGLRASHRHAGPAGIGPPTLTISPSRKIRQRFRYQHSLPRGCSRSCPGRLVRFGARAMARLHEKELTVAKATMMRPMINLPTVPSIRPTIAALLMTRAIPGSVPLEVSPR